MPPKSRRSPKASPAQPSRRARGLEFATMMGIERISDPVVSPDGRRVVFVVTRPDLAENEMRSTLRLLDLETREVRELTPGPGKHSEPAWSPDGNFIAFVSTRDEKEGRQIWVLPCAGGEAQRVTSGYGGANRPHWAPDSRRIAFWREVVVSNRYEPSKSAKPDPKKGPETSAVYGLAHPKSSAKIADTLLFRHWDTWRDLRRKHLFLVDTKTQKCEDITPYDCDVPPISLGSTIDYAFHPDGREIAFVMNPDAVVARSTNNSIFLQEIRGVNAVGAPRAISTSEACDCHPRYSADGRQVFYLAMDVPGYEADRCRLKAYDRETGETEVQLENFDRSPDEFHVRANELILAAQDRGYRSLYRFDLAKRAVTQLTEGLYCGCVRLLPGSDDLLISYETMTRPADLYRIPPSALLRGSGTGAPGVAPARAVGGSLAENQAKAKAGRSDQADSLIRLTHVGESISKLDLHDAEEFWFAGADQTPVHGFLVRPPQFRAGMKHPLILLIHGGPQSAFADHFHYRWNPQVFASAGAVVALINPRGSTGYGQRFTDQISSDWGGRCYRDLMLGVDYLLENYAFLDRGRMAAAGASFGGFMINWIAGQTDRFRVLVCHDGIFHGEVMGFTTEELWFDEYEHGGAVYEKRNSFLKYSPHLHVKNFKTPTLVVQGGQDFRCPESEGVAMFQALQMMEVPSRFLYFPDEGHWVMKPANSQVWYDELIQWMMRYLED